MGTGYCGFESANQIPRESAWQPDQAVRAKSAGVSPSLEAVLTRRIWATSPLRAPHGRLSRLDTVLFAPVGAQPLKPHGSTAPFPDRLAMTELAIAGEPGFQVSLIDAPNPGSEPNYTLHTLRTLRRDLPGRRRALLPDGRGLFRQPAAIGAEAPRSPLRLR